MGPNTTTTQGTTAGTTNATTQSAQTRLPYAPAIPYVNDIMNQAAATYASQPATPNPWTDIGFQSASNRANQYYQSAVEPTSAVAYAQMMNNSSLPQDAQGAYNSLLTSTDQPINTVPWYSDVYNRANTSFNTPLSWTANTYGQANQPLAAETNLAGMAANTTGALTPTQQAILDQNAERLSNRLASQYSGAGRYGSFGAGIGLARGIAETNNPLIAQFNQQGIQNALAANQQLTGATMGRLGLQGNLAQGYGGLLGQQGQQQLAAAQGSSNVQNMNIQNRMAASQAAINAALQGERNRLGWAGVAPTLLNAPMVTSQPEVAYGQAIQNYPWTQLQNYQAGITGLSPLIGNAGTIAATSNINQLQNALTNQTTSVPTPWTTYAGLGLAGLGALSDRRLKTDIKKLGIDPWTRLPLYAFRYKGDPKTYPKMVGPMAQDVAKKYPDQVGNVGGILYIKG